MWTFVAQSHTSPNRCVRFVFSVAATSRNTRLLPGGLLGLTWAGLAPADRACFAGAFAYSITSLATFRRKIGVFGIAVNGADKAEPAPILFGLAVFCQPADSKLRPRSPNLRRKVARHHDMVAGCPCLPVQHLQAAR
jgi:hypothetical protein